MERSLLLRILGTLPLMSSTATAQEIGDAVAGRAFARETCASCHATEPQSTASPNRSAPPFQDVASMSSMTGTALAVWLETSHPTMPNLILTPTERGNVIAYILSLRTNRE